MVISLTIDIIRDKINLTIFERMRFMFCTKCGNSLNDNAKFCNQCGASVSATEETPVYETQITAEETQPAEAFTAPEAPVCTEEPAATQYSDFSAMAPQGDNKKPSSKKKFLKFIIPAVAVVVVAAVAVTSFAQVRNAALKLFMSPADYFKYVVTTNSDDLVDSLAEGITEYKEGLTQNASATGEIKLELGDGFANLISEASGEDISAYIDWIDSAAIGINANVKDNLSDASMSLKLNDVNLADIKCIMDLKNLRYYYGLPEYNPTYLLADMNDSGYYGSPDFTEITENINKVMEALPKEATIKKILSRYIEVIAGSATNVFEDKYTLVAGGFNQNVTRLSVNIDERTAVNAARAVLIELRADADVQAIINNMSSFTGVSLSDFLEELDYAIESMSDPDAYYSDEAVLFDLYVNGKGEIIGFGVDVEGSAINSYTITKGSKFSSVTEITADGTSVSLEGNGTLSGDKRSGTYELKVIGMSVLSFALEDVSVNDGLLTGSITAEISDDAKGLLQSQFYMSGSEASLLTDMALKISSTSKSADDVNCTISLMYGDEPCVSLIATAKADDGSAKTITLPDNYVDINDYSASEEWAANLDISALIGKLRQAKLPEMFLQQLEYSINPIAE